MGHPIAHVWMGKRGCNRKSDPPTSKQVIFSFPPKVCHKDQPYLNCEPQSIKLGAQAAMRHLIEHVWMGKRGCNRKSDPPTSKQVIFSFPPKVCRKDQS